MTKRPRRDVGRLVLVRQAIEEAGRFLNFPTGAALSESAELLEAACRLLREWHTGRDPGAAGADLDESRRLRDSLSRATAKLRRASEYHARWMARWQAMGSGYMPGGEPAPPRRTGSIACTG